MSTKEGTTLIEVLLYLMLSMAIGMGTMFLTMNVYRSACEHMKRQDDLIQLGCALSYLAHDIKKASREQFSLRAQAEDSLIFRWGEGDCGWFVKKGRLMRYTGHFNIYLNTWSHRSVSMIARSATSLSVSYSSRAGVIEGVTCRLSSIYQELELFVSTRAA